MVRLGDFGARKPAQLSGGQRQRVALARAIVNRPQVLLLDEPLGALDLKLRQEMQVELKRIQGEVGITFVYVTHDQEEALTMSDRLAVFSAGRIEQVGHAGRGLRAPGQRVRGRLRRGLERRRARRAAVHDPARRRSACSERAARPRDGLHVEAGTVRRRRLRRDGHALSRRARRRRRAAGRAPEPRDVLARRPTSCAAGGCGSRGATEQTFAIDEGQSRRRGTMIKRGTWAAAVACAALFAVAGCGGSDSGGGGSRRRRRRQGRRRLQGAQGADGAERRRGRGQAQHHRLGRLRRGRLDRPEGRLGHAVREEDRLPGQRQDRQHVATRWSR